MRAVAYWPNSNVHFQYEIAEDGEPNMTPAYTARKRPVFWVLATRQEAEEYIVPYMINEVHFWRHMMKYDPTALEKVFKWKETGEFGFFVPWLPRLTDAPTLLRRNFPFNDHNEFPAWDIGPREGKYPSEVGHQGVEIPDLTHDTLSELKLLLEKIGEWHHEMRSRSHTIRL